MPTSTAAPDTDIGCENCSHPVGDPAAETVDGGHVCDDCADTMSRCEDCDRVTDTGHHTVTDTLVCDDCVDDYTRCDRCRRYATDTEPTTATTQVCTGCAAECGHCARCDTAIDGEGYSTDTGSDICHGCYTDGYSECPNCCSAVADGTGPCGSCGTPMPHTVIHPYDYKPVPVFHGRGPLYLGMELEVVTTAGQHSQAVETAVDALGELGYLKADSSIRPSGFEVVTHPMSYRYALDEFPWPLLARLRLLGCRTDTGVGLHIHLSRTGFSSPAHAYRWMKFIYRNEDAVTQLARRRTHYAAFDPRSRAHVAAAIAGRHISDRHQAINTCPTHTYELRIFASSLQRRQVAAALAFAAGSVEYTRGLRAADITRRQGWAWGTFRDWIAAHPDYLPLHQDLESLACAS